MPLPRFIIAGAPRSATTWLYMLADRHPSIAMAKPMRPEPKFFLRDELYARGLRYYEQTWFGSLPEGRVLGEKSANYFESAAAASRIACDLPEVKLIFLLRNPVERAYSNYLFSRENGFESEPFDRALELEASRTQNLPENLRFTRPFSYFTRGLYARLLGPWLNLFPRRNVLVLRTEDVEQAPESVAGRVFDFLGVSAMPGLASGLGVVNATDHAVSRPASAVFEALQERYSGPNEHLANLLGPDFTPWE